MTDNNPASQPWPRVVEADEEALVRLVVPYVRWLHPSLVASLSHDNDNYLAEWQQVLHQRKIPAEFYIWPGSACAFPGVRRKAGKSTAEQLYCLRFDHNGNRFAHKVWELLGNSVAHFKAERADYELVHLLPHQPTEWQKLFAGKKAQEFDLQRTISANWQAHLAKSGLPALFSNPANMCFLPSIMVRPTDGDSLLRLVLWKKALALYGCETLLPPGLAQPLVEWLQKLPDIEGLNWSQCYHGSERRMHVLLQARHMHLRSFLAASQ